MITHYYMKDHSLLLARLARCQISETPTFCAGISANKMRFFNVVSLEVLNPVEEISVSRMDGYNTEHSTHPPTDRQASTQRSDLISV